jgi:hypothetical protein
MEVVRPLQHSMETEWSGLPVGLLLPPRSMKASTRARYLLVASLFVAASSVLADDFKTLNGKEYKNATVSRVEPDGIVIKVSGGIVKIPFTALSRELQESNSSAKRRRISALLPKR